MKKTLLLLLVGVIAILTLAWCSSISTSQNKWPEIIKIWVIAPLSGPAANYWEDSVNAYRYVADKFNSENSWKIRIDLIVEDGKCDGKSASSAAQKLVSIDKVQVIVWWLCSVETVPAGKIAQQNQVAMIAAVSSAAEIANIWEYVFRYWNDANVTKKLSDYLKNSNVKNLFILTENTDYGIGYLKWMKDNFKWSIIEENFQSGEKDFDILAKKVMNSDADAVLAITNSDSNTINMYRAFEKQWVLEKFKGNIYWTEITVSDSSIKEIGSLLNWVKAANLISMEELGQRAKDFMKEFSVQHTALSASLWIVLEAEAMQLAIDAITNVWNNGTAIKNYFTSFNANKLRQGYFWDYYFTPERDAYGLDFLVYEIQDGKLVNGK
jgi:branched-chain amino acid transport system substrate-binding protein